MEKLKLLWTLEAINAVRDMDFEYATGFSVQSHPDGSFSVIDDEGYTLEVAVGVPTDSDKPSEGISSVSTLRRIASQFNYALMLIDELESAEKRKSVDTKQSVW